MSIVVTSDGEVDTHLRSSNLKKFRKPLRVLFIIDSRFPGLGGAENQAIKLAKGLRAEGVHVEFLAPQVMQEHGAHDEVDGFKITRIMYPHIKKVGAIIMLFRFALYLIKSRNDFDCHHIHITRTLTAVAGVIRPITGVPIITKISGFFEFEGGVLDPKKTFNPVNALMRIAMRNVDYVQTISAETKSKLLAAGFRQEQLLLIPNGIDTSNLVMPRKKNDTFTIGYCGRLREVKGVHVLLDAYSTFRQKNKHLNTELVLAGSGSAEDDLREQCNQLGIADEVRFLGTIEDTSAFYETLDVYVQPSFAEGLPNSVMEAMLAALPVLASDIGGNQDLVSEAVSGYLFDAGDSDKLAQLLEDCSQNSEMCQKLGLNGQGYIAENYGMGSVVKGFIEKYHEKQYRGNLPNRVD